MMESDVRYTWDRNPQVKWASVELARSINDLVNNWNISIGVWLKNYVFDRWVREDGTNKTAATLLTRMFSAFWHGFSLGYYLFFSCTVLID